MVTLVLAEIHMSNVNFSVVRAPRVNFIPISGVAISEGDCTYLLLCRHTHRPAKDNKAIWTRRKGGVDGMDGAAGGEVDTGERE